MYSLNVTVLHWWSFLFSMWMPKQVCLLKKFKLFWIVSATLDLLIFNVSDYGTST